MHRLIAAAFLLLLSCVGGTAVAQVAPHPTFTGTITGPDSGTWSSTGITATGANVTGTGGYKIGGNSLSVVAADNSGGAPVAGGTGTNAAGDVLTLNDGCATHVQMTVQTVNGSNQVTSAAVSNRGFCSLAPANPVGVLSSSGGGSGAGVGVTFNLNWVMASTVNGFGAAPSTANNGQMLLGYNAGANMKTPNLGPIAIGPYTCGGGLTPGEGLANPTGLTGGEDTCIGYATGTMATTISFTTLVGHSAGYYINDANFATLMGTDCGKYMIHGNNVSGYGADCSKYSWNGARNDLFGVGTLQGNFINPTVTGAVSGTGGAVELTVSTTGITSGDAVFVYSVGGVTGANTLGTPVLVTVIDSTHLLLNGTTFGGTYTSGGAIIDMPAGFINQAITGTTNSGGLIELTVNNTYNMNTNDSVTVAGVGGTTEANGTWLITVNTVGCTAPSVCHVTLQSSAYVNAYTSGGHLTDLKGPTAMDLFGYNSFQASGLTGSNQYVATMGSGTASQAICAMADTVIGAGVGSTTFGTACGNYADILIGVDPSTDVISTAVVNAVGIGQGVKLSGSSVQIGQASGGVPTNNAAALVDIGAFADNAETSGFNKTVIGPNVAKTGCQSGTNLVLLGTNNNTTCTTTGESSAIHLGAGASDILHVTGTGTPTSALITWSGPVFMGATAPTIAGCSATAPTGEGASGTYTSGTTGTCTVVVTLNGATGITAPHGWVVKAFDTTTAADTQSQTATTATTVTISGTTVSGDVVAFAAQPY